jgi:hypothetical protein
MSTTRSFSGISAETVARMKEFGRAQYGIVFDPPDGPNSIATSQTPFGECVIAFAYDRERAELTLNLVKKPWLLPESVLWNGFLSTLERCRSETATGEGG